MQRTIVRNQARRRKKATNKLVLVSCSAAKREIPATPIPAIDRYNGVLFKVIRKNLPVDSFRPRIRIAIVSAKYGFVTESMAVPLYDQKLNASRAEVIRANVRKGLRGLLRRRQFDRIFVSLGRSYAALVEDLPELQRATWATGSIGKRAAALKAWMNRKQ